MTITREDLNPATVRLTIALDSEEVAQGFEKALKQIAKQIKVPGFRPGHAPKSMVAELIDDRALYDEAAEQLVKSTFKKAIDEQELKPDATVRPSLEVKKLDKATGECEYIAKIPLPAVVELGDYTGLPVEKPAVTVSDEEIEYQITELRQRQGKRESITDRGVAEGDVVVLNIKPDGSEGDGRNFMLVAGQTFGQLDQALAGMQVEQTKHLDLTFPENFQEKDWAGKPLTCLVRVNSLSTMSLPELDDEFAKSLKTNNVEELKARISEGIKTAKENMLREIVHDQLMDSLLERSTVHVSDNMWEPIVVQRLNDLAKEQAEKGKNLTQYAEENGMKPEELTGSLESQAQLHIKRAIMIREIFTKEEMKISNDELNDELRLMASEYGVAPMEMLDILKENRALDELQFRTLSRKVTDFLTEKADIKEISA
jgi:trigger factor